MPGRSPLGGVCIFSAPVLFALALGGCNRPAAPPQLEPSQPQPANLSWFDDITSSSGFHFVHDPGQTGSYCMPQSMGSGCAFLDADGDGLLDIFLVHQG